MRKIKEIKNINPIVELPPNSRVIVDGLPGTGKTESVIRRIKYLIDDLDINPNDNLLVLSFTRNAVREIKNRVLESIEHYHQNINVLTFDQFAWRLLTYTHVEGPAHARDYESNIILATKLLRNGVIINKKRNLKTHSLDQWGELKSLQYLILDEVQDVNTFRAEFTLEILNFLKKNYEDEMGFLFLGDLNQEIFAYQGLDPKYKRFKSSSEFLRTIRTNLKTEDILLMVDFDNNLRYVDLDPRVKDVIIHATRIIKNYNFTRSLLKRQINDYLPRTDPISEISDLKRILLAASENGETTALLYRRNNQASAISLRLFQNGIKHHYLIEGSVYPSWIARICYQLYMVPEDSNGKFKILKRKAFRDTWNNGFSDRIDIPWEKAWILFVFIAYGKEANLPEIKYSRFLKNFLKNFDESQLEDYGTKDSRILITNFHKAKGREYDRVLINEFIYPSNTRADFHNEARVMYVGITRARKTCKIFKYEPRNYRPYKITEFIPEDNERIFPIAEVFPSEDPYSFIGVDYRIANERQEYLWKNDLIGEPIKIEIYEEEDKLGDIIHNSFIIGTISKFLDLSLKRWLRKYYNSAKNTLLGGYIVAVYTNPPELTPGRSNGLETPFDVLKIWISVKLLGILYVESN